MQSRKIGIMGGTFDPIHNGHIQIAIKAYQQFELDKIIFIPSGVSYLKKNRNVSSTKHRLNMVELAIKDYPYFETSTIEIDREGNSYTYETLEELKAKNPSDDLYFILGADSLMYIEKWINPESIFRNCTIICAVRDENTLNILSEKYEELKVLGAKVLFLNMEPINISSTEIRNFVIDNKNIDSFVSKDVEKYILQEHLYEIN